MNFELPEEPLILILLQWGSEAFNRWKSSSTHEIKQKHLKLFRLNEG
jgi:hypothetical protein